MCVLDLGCYTLIAAGRSILITLVWHIRHLWKTLFGLKQTWFVLYCLHWLVIISLSFTICLFLNCNAPIASRPVVFCLRWNVYDLLVLEWLYLVILFSKQHTTECSCMPRLTHLHGFKKFHCTN